MLLPLVTLLFLPAHADDSNDGGGGAEGNAPAILGAEVNPIAQAQVWLTAYDMDEDVEADATGYGDPEDDPGLKLKRLRLGLGGNGKKWDYRFVIGNSAPYDGLSAEEEDLQVVDAFITAEPAKGCTIRTGVQKVPFSRDQLMSSMELVFTERGIGSEHIAPDRDLGVLFGLERRGGKFSLGVFNSGGNLFGDDTSGKTFAGRLEWATGKADTYKTWGDRREFGFGAGANGYYTMGIATSTWAAGGDLMLRTSGLSILVDGAYSQLSPTNTDIESSEVFAETTRWGFTTQVSYQLRAFEPAVRFSMFDDSSLGQYSQLLAGGEWHTAEDHVRVGAGYELRLEGDDAYDNDTARLWAQFRL